MDRDVLAADQLPKSLLRNYPFACIVNTDSSSKEGQHWVTYYFNLEGDGEFFDSLGKSPNAYNRIFSTFLLQNASKSQYNDIKLQHESSDVCDQYCVYYLMFKARGYSMQEIVKSLSFTYSDQYVYDVIKNIFPMCFSPQIICNRNQICKSMLKMYFDNKCPVKMKKKCILVSLYTYMFLKTINRYYKAIIVVYQTWIEK